MTTKLSNPILDAAVYAKAVVINYMVTAAVSYDIIKLQLYYVILIVLQNYQFTHQIVNHRYF